MCCSPPRLARCHARVCLTNTALINAFCCTGGEGWDEQHSPLGTPSGPQQRLEGVPAPLRYCPALINHSPWCPSAQSPFNWDRGGGTAVAHTGQPLCCALSLGWGFLHWSFYWRVLGPSIDGPYTGPYTGSAQSVSGGCSALLFGGAQPLC